MPFYPYSRSDKKDKPGLPIMAKVIANILQMQDITRLITMDLHSGQIQGFANFPFDNLYATDIFKDYFENELFVESSKDHFILVSPDNGSVKTIDDYASQLNMPYVIMHKQRDYTKKNTVIKSVLVGDCDQVRGKTGIIIDDMIDTMGTITSSVHILEDYGIESVIVVATHGLFSGPAIERLNECSIISRVVVTNIRLNNDKIQYSEKIRVIDISSFLVSYINKLITMNK